MLEYSIYHKILRVTAVVFALLLVFVSGVVSDTTAQLSRGTEMYLANAVGMNASVQPTELNMYTAELTKRERELDAREEALRDREIAIGLENGEGSPASDTSTYLLASILFILLVLILLNYTLDYLRSKEAAEVQPV